MAGSGDTVIKLEPNKGSDDEIDSHDQVSSHVEEETIHNPGDTDSDTKQHGDGPQSEPKMSTKVDKGQDNENGQRPKGLTGEIQHHEHKDAQKNALEVKQESNESSQRKSEKDQDSSHEGLIGKIQEGEQEDERDGIHVHERDDIHVHEQDVIQEHEQDGIQEVNESKTIWWFLIPVVIVLLALVYQLHHSTPPVQKDIDVVDVFIERMAKVKSSFPNQRPELWKRSRIHISRHLKTVNPTEPVSLILTSGHGSERTLGCLAQRLAESFSGTLNSSVLNIDGKSKTLEDSDQVKLDIDSDLRKAFEGKMLAAVIHRFEELPPGSSLIFYRYCDHENAAYKKVFLVFTVMLDALVEIPYNASLAGIEDMVHDQIKRKFVSSDKSAVFNQMDVDKLSGLWSRISHLILPVARVERIERQGCGSEGESF